MNRHQHSGQLHRHVAFNRKFPPTPTLRGTPTQYKRRNSGLASVLTQYASGRTTSNSKHSHRRSLHCHNTKYQPSRRYRSRGRYLSASILIGIDVPEGWQRQVPTNQKIQRTVERTQVRVHRDMYRSSRSSRRCPERMPIIWKIQKTVETSQERLWTVPRILKFQKTVEYATGPCDSESRRLCVSDRYRTWT